MPLILPVNYLIHNCPLFSRGLAKVDSCCLDTLMPHQISQKRNIVAAFQEALCEAVTEGVWVYYHRIDTVPDCQLFSLPGDTSCGDSVPVFVQKNKAAFLVLIVQPRKGFILQSFWYVYSSELSALRA